MPPRFRSGKSELDLDPVLGFMRILWGVEHALQSASKRMEATHRITGPQRMVLRVVDQFPNLSAGELAHALRLHPSTVTGILQRLGHRGLLTREVDPEDSRRVRLKVTAAAKPFIHHAKGTIEAAIAKALSGARVRDLAKTEAVLTSVIAELAEAGR
jgi:MarR family transcriptional regulator, organic hydroperoxide resistance regulator